MRKFGTASVRVPFQRKRSTSSSHGERRGDGGSLGTSFWTEGHVGVPRLPDPPALCAVKLQSKLVQRWEGSHQNPTQMAPREANPRKFFCEVFINFGQFSMSRTWFFYLKPILTQGLLVRGCLPWRVFQLSAFKTGALIEESVWKFALVQKTIHVCSGGVQCSVTPTWQDDLLCRTLVALVFLACGNIVQRFTQWKQLSH